MGYRLFLTELNQSESVINKIQRVQDSFIRLPLRLPKYVSARLIHEPSRLQRETHHRRPKSLS